MQVVTDKGTVTVTPTEVSLIRKGENEQNAFFRPRYSHAVEHEVDSFARAISIGKMEQRATTEEAFMDLTTLQAMLESGEDGGAVKAVG